MKIGVVIPDRGDRPEFLKNCMRMLAGQTVLPAMVVLVTTPKSPSRVRRDETKGDFEKDSSQQPASSALRAPSPQVEKGNSQQPASRFTTVYVESVAGVCDITKRYRTGYDLLRGKGLDVIAFIENDDWYAPDYLERMGEQWELAGRPDLFGTAYTIYYHIGLQAWLTMEHRRRASAMNTLIKPDLNITWCADSEPYTDIHLWTPPLNPLKGTLNEGPVVFTADLNSLVEREGCFNVIKPKPGYEGGGIGTRVTFNPMEVFKRHISVGIKHGVGLCGGRNHTNYLERYKFEDRGMVALRSWIGAEACAFYKSIGHELHE